MSGKVLPVYYSKSDYAMDFENPVADNSDALSLKSDEQIYRKGTYKNVWRGSYTKGSKKGQSCILKQITNGPACEQGMYPNMLKTRGRAQDIIEKWNHQHLSAPKFRLSKQHSWQRPVNIDSEATDDSSTAEPSMSKERPGDAAHSKASGLEVRLIGDFIDNYTIFNSSSGWALREEKDTEKGKEKGESSARTLFTTALSHFSYHVTQGKLLLCDLQGGYGGDGQFTLTDPVVMTQIAGTYGPADLGIDGHRSWFQRHARNNLCGSWIKPGTTSKAVIRRSQGTAMMFDSAAQQSTRTPEAPRPRCDWVAERP